MDLQTLANLAEIIGIFIVAGGFVFGVLQIVEYRRHRSDLAAFELARIWHEPNFTRAIGIVLDLPIGISGKELLDRGPDALNAAMVVALNLETVGLMVHRRFVGLDIVWELMGGMTLSSWERLEGWIRNSRAHQESEKFGEWIEWLVTQLRTRQATNNPPAHVRYQDWTP